MKDKHILITGASGGIGFELVKKLVFDGFTNISCQYNNNEKQLQQLLGENFAKRCFKANLTNEIEVKNLHDHISQFGKLTGLINLVGASTNVMSWKMSTDDFKSIMDTNLLSTFLTCREFIPEMREQNFGRIINSSSVVAFTGIVGSAHYCAAKAAIVGFTRAIAMELVNKNITANSLAMGYIDKGLITQLSQELQETTKAKIPLKRFGTVNEICGLVKFLLSDDSSYMTGQVIHMNGGMYL